MPDCSDVLRNGTFNSLRYHSNFAIDQVLANRFIRSTYDQAKNDTNAGFGIPIGKVFLRGDFSESDFKERQEQIKNSLDFSSHESQEIQIALASGDKTIISGWLQCMEAQGGPRVIAYAKVDSATEATVTFKLAVGNSTITEGVFAQDVAAQLPAGVTIAGDGRKLLAKGMLINNAEQKINIKFPDHLTTLPLVFNVNHKHDPKMPLGSAEIYIPRRVRGDEQRDAVESGYMHMHANPSERTKHTITLQISDQQFKDGWRWYGEPIVSIKNKDGVRNRTWLDSKEKNSQTYFFHFIVDNNARNDSANSEAKVIAEIRRIAWVSI